MRPMTPASLILSLTAVSNQHSALLEREDYTLVAWYPCVYAPRTGGAYDSHHRTAGIASRARRRGGRVAARGARAAGGADAAHRGAHEPGRGRFGNGGAPRGVSARLAGIGLERRPQPADRLPLGRG